MLATASTLRWQMQLPPEDESHEVFWRQLLHAISAKAPPRASIEPERLAYDDERNVRLVAELRNERFEPINDASVELRIAPQAEPAFAQSMQPSGQGDGRYVAGIDAATAGLYRIEMTAQAGGREVGNAITHVLRNDGVAEHFAHASASRRSLERLAAMTGGRYWPLDDLDGLAAAIPYSKAGVVERQTLDLWNLPIVFLLLLLLKAVGVAVAAALGKAVRDAFFISRSRVVRAYRALCRELARRSRSSLPGWAANPSTSSVFASRRLRSPKRQRRRRARRVTSSC